MAGRGAAFTPLESRKLSNGVYFDFGILGVRIREITFSREEGSPCP
jgi:hypothetical protein